MTLTAGVTYAYDGDGKRVQKSNGKLYWYGMGSDPLDETDLAGNTNNASFNEYIFFGGKRIARRDSANTVNYYFADHLGTARVATNSSGIVCYNADFYPFGGERIVTDTCDSAYKFTGKERDSESGLDDFGARYYTSTLGRFMRADEPNVDQDPANPQSWSLYIYVRNNPLNNIDPDGRKCEKDKDGNFHGDTCNQDTGTGNKPDQIHVKTTRLPLWGFEFPARKQTESEKRFHLWVAAHGATEVRAELPILFGPVGSLSAAEALELTYMARLSGILREAAVGKGNFGLGEATAAEAAELGEAWVGPGARTASDGVTRVSDNGLRVYRPPSYKPSQGAGEF